MRVMSYLHLTRFVRILLDRKDRMSMAVGLEVRVPFCDHRLVEYVYNTPWALKTYDGREKSLLRGAARDVLPESVVKRVKSPYPSTSDPQYGAAIQAQVKDLLGSADDMFFGLIDREALEQVTRADPATMPPDLPRADRAGAGHRGLDGTVPAAWCSNLRTRSTRPWIGYAIGYVSAARPRRTTPSPSMDRVGHGRH